MADYYPVLARAVAGLAHNDAQARRDLYARARTVVAEQLRGRTPQSPAREATREQAALETAIRRIEAEARAGQSQTLKKPAAAPVPRQPAAVAGARESADNTARSLSKILQAVQPDAIGDGAGQPSHRNAMNRTAALVPGLAPSAAPKAAAAAPTKSDYRTSNPSAELGGAPSSFGTLLFATAYIVAALAFTGVTYIRCMVWLYQGVIGYPILLGTMVSTLGLFIAPPLMFFRKTSTLPSVDALMRYIHTTSRRVL
jgi:hypothetical protein